MTNQPNVAKGLLIRRALSKAKLASKSGFHLEVIALSDSIISECINRIQIFSSEEHFTIKGINDGCKKLTVHKVPIFDTSLLEDTLAWGKNRNAAIHGFTKLNEYEGASWEERTLQVEKQAGQGLTLVRRWLREAPKHKI
jgi:hypothetical protein